MTVDMFLALEGVKSGPIKGESVDKVHKDEIDVLAFSWGASQTGTMHVGGGGGGGKANFQDLSVTTYYEKSTNVLLKLCGTGEHIKKGLLTVRKAGGEAEEYIKFEIKDALVSSISVGGSGGEERLTVNYSLNFRDFEVQYFPQKEDGTLDTAVRFGMSIPRNEVTSG